MVVLGQAHVADVDLDHALVVAPGMRSRIAPNARAAPPPSWCTPGIARADTPAIFDTTVSAICVRPCGVARPEPPGEEAADQSAVREVDVPTGVVAFGAGLLTVCSS